MPLLLLLVFMLASLPIQWPAPIVGGTLGGGTCAGIVVAGLLVLAWLFRNDTVRKLQQHPEEYEPINKLYAMRRLLYFFANLAGFAFLMVVCGWGWTVRQTLTRDDVLLPGAEFVILLPYLTSLMGSWFFFYDAERALHDHHAERQRTGPFWTRGGYVTFLLRHHLLMVFLPMVLVVTQMGVARAFPEWMNSLWGGISALAVMVGLVLFLPSLIPLILGLHPMPESPLRTRLEQAAKRLGVRYHNLYIWNTRSNLATALVAGLIPRFRNIVFTDLLLTTLTDDEIEAVLGHEAGHVRHGHLWYYTAFLLVSFTAIGALYRLVELSEWASGISNDVLLVCSVVCTGLYLFMVFGFLSRRCERQADLFGCRAVSCGDPHCSQHTLETTLVPRGKALCPTGIRTFMSALERVEQINGLVRGTAETPRRGVVQRLSGLLRLVGVVMATWQHSTIAKRVAYLETIIVDSSKERRFQRQLLLLRWGLLFGLLAGTMLLGFAQGWRELLLSIA